MEAPKCINDIQKINGQVTAFCRFMSCSAKRCLPFFKVLKVKTSLCGGRVRCGIPEFENFLIISIFAKLVCRRQSFVFIFVHYKGNG